jgi:cytochrome c oxidase subunit IV
MRHDHAVPVKGYMVVFGALLALTLLTVGVSYVDKPPALTVAVGLALATAKAGLVAWFFMHLSHERRIVYLTLAVTVMFFVALIGLILWTEADHITGAEFTQPFDHYGEVR